MTWPLAYGLRLWAAAPVDPAPNAIRTRASASDATTAADRRNRLQKREARSQTRSPDLLRLQKGSESQLDLLATVFESWKVDSRGGTKCPRTTELSDDWKRDSTLRPKSIFDRFSQRLCAERAVHEHADEVGRKSPPGCCNIFHRCVSPALRSWISRIIVTPPTRSRTQSKRGRRVCRNVVFQEVSSTRQFDRPSPVLTLPRAAVSCPSDKQPSIRYLQGHRDARTAGSH